MSSLQTVRDRALSLWQSAVEEVLAHPKHGKGVAGLPQPAGTNLPTISWDAIRQLPMAKAATELAVALHNNEIPDSLRMLPTARTPAASGEWSVATRSGMLALELAWAKLQGDDRAIQAIQDELLFSACDPGWAEVIERYLAYYVKGQGSIAYRTGGDYILDPLPDQATIALIGDWGTGSASARQLLEALHTQHEPDVVIHLGDIYYSGTPAEVQGRFLAVCKSVLPSATRIYSLAGNHDMYSGGAGYYWLVDQLGQRASHFGLRNAGWQLLAMDTGYNDFNPFDVASNVTSLTTSELAWHRAQLAEAGPRKTILLSHHPLFSAFEGIGGRPINSRLQNQLGALLPNVSAWFWGHEHRLELYAPFLGLRRGRCLGCSAIPALVHEDYFTPTFPDVPQLVDAGQPIRLGNNGTIYNHAYAILTLAGPAGVASYYQLGDPPRQALFTESLT